MATASKQGRRFVPDTRTEALKTLIQLENGRGSLDPVCEPFLAKLPFKARPFYTALVKGVIRNLRLLDFTLENLLERPLDSLTPSIRNLLRLAGFQLQFMQIPKPVTVDVMVELSKSFGHAGTVRFVNGVLRHWACGYSPPLPGGKIESLGIRYSHPDWLVEKWIRRYAESEIEELLKWNNSIPPLEIRANRMRISPEELFLLFREKEIPATHSGPDAAFSLEWHGSLESIPGFAEGLFWVQGESALLPVEILSPIPGEKIADLCAAPGGKSCQIADLMENQGEIISVDIRPPRVNKIEENRRRMGLPIIRPTLADARDLAGPMAGWADAVLLDAPCSSTGVFRKNVDARWNRSPEDFPRYQQLQSDLLRAAAEIVKSGGRIVYSTCSLEPEENEEVIRGFIGSHPDFVLQDPFQYLAKSTAERISNGASFIRILPQKHRMDGFFIARLKKS